MHARATTIQAPDPGRIDEAIEEYRSALEQFRDIEGNQGAVLLADRGSGKGIGITLWADEQAMSESRQRAEELREQAAQSVGGEIQSVEEFEVAIWEPRA